MLTTLVIAGVAFCAYGQDAHNHGDVNFEWAGIFETGAAMYMWTAQKVGVTYADGSMKMAALPTNSATEEELHHLESEGIHALETACVELQPYGTIVPELDKCYKLQFDTSMWQSLFMVNASATSAIAFFTEHVPTEFEATAHYLKDDAGEDIEPVSELPEAPSEAAPVATSDDKPWGDAIGAALVIQFVTLIGVVFAVPVVAKVVDRYQAESLVIFSGFAAGALLSCAFLLLLFEATHLVATGWDEEVDVLWRWGAMVLVGFALPGVVDIAVSMIANFKVPEPHLEAADGEKQPVQKEGGLSVKARLLAGVLIGDFFHNLCDGFFVAAAFEGCGKSFGWTVALATVLHELPQEICDYSILTGPVLALGPFTALFANFLSGLSVILGVIVVLSVEVSNSNIGLLLAFGAGVYIHIAATECMPKIYNEKISLRIRGAGFLSFIVGAVLIGLVLLDHEHCVPDAPVGADAPAASGHHH